MPIPGPSPTGPGGAEPTADKDGNDARAAAEEQPAEDAKVAKALEAAKAAPEGEQAAEPKAPRKAGEAER